MGDGGHVFAVNCGMNICGQRITWIVNTKLAIVGVNNRRFICIVDSLLSFSIYDTVMTAY